MIELGVGSKDNPWGINPHKLVSCLGPRGCLQALPFSLFPTPGFPSLWFVTLFLRTRAVPRGRHRPSASTGARRHTGVAPYRRKIWASEPHTPGKPSLFRPFPSHGNLARDIHLPDHSFFICKMDVMKTPKGSYEEEIGDGEVWTMGRCWVS